MTDAIQYGVGVYNHFSLLNADPNQSAKAGDKPAPTKGAPAQPANASPKNQEVRPSVSGESRGAAISARGGRGGRQGPTRTPPANTGNAAEPDEDFTKERGHANKSKDLQPRRVGKPTVKGVPVPGAEPRTNKRLFDKPSHAGTGRIAREKKHGSGKANWGNFSSDPVDNSERAKEDAEEQKENTENVPAETPEVEAAPAEEDKEVDLDTYLKKQQAETQKLCEDWKLPEPRKPNEGSDPSLFPDAAHVVKKDEDDENQLEHATKKKGKAAAKKSAEKLNVQDVFKVRQERQDRQDGRPDRQDRKPQRGGSGAGSRGGKGARPTSEKNVPSMDDFPSLGGAK